jgi:predicted acylesterase/phospholipase RssA
MGAILAAEYAYGYDWEEMITITGNVMRQCFQGELTMPMVAILKGHQVARLILDVMGQHDLDIEDLWLPYFCVSTNLTRSQMHVHTTGSVLMSILASSRAPGMYPPIVLNGDLLIDGGIVNNVPADVMRDLSNGARVIAVNVSPRVDETMTADYGFGISGWQVLLGRLNPFRKKKPATPNLLHILMRTVAFGAPSPLGTALGPADLDLSPPLEMFKINDFHRGPEIADTAYRFALPRVQEWKAMPDARVE